MKTTKQIIIIFISFIALPYTLLSEWKKVDARPDISRDYINSNYVKIQCADSMNCMILGTYNGAGGYYFRRTTDGGNTWKNVYQDSAYWYDKDNYHGVPNINDIAYPNTNLFIAIGDSGLVIRTTDKGETWEKIIYDKKLNLSGLVMLDNDYGIMNGNILLETLDGGKTWIAAKKDIYLESVNLINRNLFCGISMKKISDSIY